MTPIQTESFLPVPPHLREFFGEDTEIPVLTVTGCGSFSAAKTFDCGQAFRFDPVNETTFAGTAFGCKIAVEQTVPGTIHLYRVSREQFELRWRHYLALDEDYDAIDRLLIDAMPTQRDRAVMTAAVEAGRGIRILRQDPFETLISFIVSQNNNIPRIKKIIRTLCETYGENGAFPTAEALAEASVDDLYALKTGFRAKYIHDAACRVASGELDLQKILACENYAACDAMLRTVHGVGPKVSACVLLYGFGKTEAFPVDVWIKKSLERHFPDGFDAKRLGKYAGIAQQYLFYYERYING
ncbi:MAG: DNA-3-methyladenine glycosylase 2 family protein [Clostridia bacterium]|nr:DNA-3-methyladenine glycosylase 2 family protein [Clostridia bacterium]